MGGWGWGGGGGGREGVWFHLRDPESGQRLPSDLGVVGKIGDISWLVDFSANLND